MSEFENIDYYDNLFNLGDRRMDIDVPLRLLRDAQDPYAMDVEKFKLRYRFTQDTVKNVILPIIFQDLVKENERGLPIAPELQIIVALRFYATSSFQIVCGDLLSLSQPSVSNIVARVSFLLAQKHMDFIKYPQNMTPHRLEFTRLGQYNNYPGLQNIDGAIDCTHVKIVNTPGVQHHEAFRNRKSYFSINVQAVVGPAGQFLDIVARWAGSTHDSWIFQMCSLKNKYEQGIHNGKLVGDSGYPCLPYLLTPINPPRDPAQEIYNKVHVKTRNPVERTFGRWKRRFPCLQRGLGNKLATVSNVIVACAVLFNIAQHVNDEEIPTDEPLEAEDNLSSNDPENSGSAEGFAIRDAIVRSYS